MTTDELNTKVLKLLIEHLKHEKKDDRNAEYIRVNAEWLLNLKSKYGMKIYFKYTYTRKP